MDMSKYREMFLSETREHLQKMNDLLAGLAPNPAEREGIDALFREVHSVKGMAASMGYERTTALAHHLEDLMDSCRREGLVPAAAIGRLQTGFDLLEGLVEDLEGNRPERETASFLQAGPTGADEPAPAAGEPPAGGPTDPLETPPAAPDLLQVVVKFVAGTTAPAARALLVLRELGRLGQVVASRPEEEELARGGALDGVTVQVKTGRTAAEVREILLRMSDVERVSLSAGGDAPFQSRREDAVRSVRINTELLDRFIDLTGELITNRYILQSALREKRWPELREGLDQQVRLIGTLHHYVLRARMMPLESITGRLPRLVRELCRRTGKNAALRLEGQEVELDRAIMEGLADPLMHLVRNAVDHGIEQRGEVLVRAWRDKDQVLLEVADNGRGMDPAVLCRTAADKGLITPAQAKSMRPADALHLVCLPGFSTAASITETSGRGVGMDVVKSAVESLGGSLVIESAAGQGTRFLLKMPLSVAIINLLLVECAGHVLGIPFTRLLRAEELARTEVRARGKQAVATIGGEEVPLLSLRKILGLPTQAPGETVSLVLTEARGRRVALVVDRLAGQRQAFVKSLGFPLDRLPGVSGATVLGDGSVIFIIDPQTLLEGKPGRLTGRKERSHDLHPVDGRAA